MYSITLSDGTKISGLGLSGNNFTSKTEITADVFAGKLSSVKVECSGDASEDVFGLVGEHAAMELVQVRKYGEEWYFILLDA